MSYNLGRALLLTISALALISTAVAAGLKMWALISALINTKGGAG